LMNCSRGLLTGSPEPGESPLACACQCGCLNQGKETIMKKILAIIGFLVAIPVGAFIIFCLYDLCVPKQCVVYLDNGLDEAVSVRIDGKNTITVNSHAFSRQVLGQGPHTFEVFDKESKPLEEAAFTYEQKNVGAKQKYIYNIKSANDYAEYTLEYGTAKVKYEDRVRQLPKEKFFKSPRQMMELCDAFPSTVTIRKGSGGATRTIVAHFPPHRRYECCRKFVESVNKK